jgi:hypothetical protein
MINEYIIGRLKLGHLKSNKTKAIAIFLNSPTCWDMDEAKGSIMSHGEICEHDTGYMCECRIQHLLDFINDNFNEKP